MSMHLEGPWLTTTGKLKSKRRKWASSAQKKNTEVLAAQWEDNQKKWASMAPRFSPKPTATKKSDLFKFSPSYPPGREPQNIPSRDSGLGVAARREAPVYTGDKIKGIGTLHKSNAVPVFTDDEAIDLAHMRR